LTRNLSFHIVASPFLGGAEIAQSVEHRTENPSVPGSNPGLGTIVKQKELHFVCSSFFITPESVKITKRVHVTGKKPAFFCKEIGLFLSFLLDRNEVNV
jgi:hypothetical protein